MPHTSRSGHLPHAGRFLEANANGGLVTWLKRAEDGDGVILRALETEGQPGESQISSSSLALRLHGNRGFIALHGFALRLLRTEAEFAHQLTDVMRVKINACDAPRGLTPLP